MRPNDIWSQFRSLELTCEFFHLHFEYKLQPRSHTLVVIMSTSRSRSCHFKKQTLHVKL